MGWALRVFSMKLKFKKQTRPLAGIIACILAIGLGPAGELRADDFDTLIAGWAAFVTGGTNLNLSDPNISNQVTSVAVSANNYWNSMIKTNGRTYLWSDAASTKVSADLTTCYRRISSMAQGWAMTGSPLYHNSSLADDILSALDWMHANRYNETKSQYNNWWDWKIGAPMALNQTMVLIYPQLSGARITNYCKAIDHFCPVVKATGANRVWMAEVVGVRGAVGRDAAKVAAARDGLSDVAGDGGQNVFAYVTSGDGFYRDGGFIQHNRHPYTAGYGLSLFRDVARMMDWLSPTAYKITDSQMTNVVQWCYDSFEPLIYYGALPEHVRGRNISRNTNGFDAGHGVINTILRVAQTAPPNDAARLKSMVKYWAQVDPTATLPSYVDMDLMDTAENMLTNAAIKPRGELVKSFQFPSMDRIMHLRPGFGFGLSLFSSRIYNYESINGENLHGWFTAYGMTYLWTTNDLEQFTDAYWPTVDPYHLPGTTTALTVLTNGANRGALSSQSWVGGAVLSNSLIAAGMSLAGINSTLVAKKSWFMFNNEIVCLGAGISCRSATNLHTSAKNVFTVNGVTLPIAPSWSSNLNNVSWCALDASGGYYFPGGANLLAARTARTGSWSDINATLSGTYTRNYLSLILNHGVAPDNAAYAYVVLPNFSVTDTANYAAHPAVVILTNTASVQAVREIAQNVTAANFWTSGGGAVDFITSQNQAAMLTRETNGILEVAVSDPTWLNTSNIMLTLNRRAASLISADPGVTVLSLSPQIRVTANVNGARGQTLQAKFALAKSADAAR